MSSEEIPENYAEVIEHVDQGGRIGRDYLDEEGNVIHTEVVED